MPDLDCLVVGLGPAGATALRDLRMAGVQAAGIDKAVFPRSKPCGGALSALAQSQITAPGWESLVEGRLQKVRLALRYGKELTHTASKPICSFVMRDKLDAFLLAAAAEAGADIRTGVELHHVEIDNRSVVAFTNKGRITARCLLGCDGANSRVAGFVGADRPCGAALEAEIDLPAELAARHEGEVYLSYGAPARGYGWLFPKRNHLSVGVGSFSPRSQGLRRELQNFLDHCGLTAGDAQIVGHRIPLGGQRRPVQKGPVLLAGDAASFLDPLSGEGIAYALLSGHLAAKHIQSLVEGRSTDFRAYERETNARIVSELALARWIAQRLYVFPGVFYQLLQRSPETIALYFQVVAGDATYRQLTRHLKQRFLSFGIFQG